MKFESRKDTLFRIIFLGICAFVIGITLVGLLQGGIEKDAHWALPVVLGFVGFLLWLHFATNYELNEKEFIYKYGPFSGKISIDRIREIEKGKTLWAGIWKPATARQGLLMRYDKFKEIYISPKTNESFIEKILELNSGIIITDRKAAPK